MRVSFAPEYQTGGTNVQLAGRVTPESLLSGDGKGVGALGYGYRRGSLMDFQVPRSEPSSVSISLGLPPPPTSSPIASQSVDFALQRSVTPHYGLPPPLPSNMMKGQAGSRDPGLECRGGGRGMDVEGPQGLAGRLEEAMGAIGASRVGGSLSGQAQGAIGGAGLLGYGSQSASNDPGFQTPRSSVLNRQFDRDGYPVSPQVL